MILVHNKNTSLLFLFFILYLRSSTFVETMNANFKRKEEEAFCLHRIFKYFSRLFFYPKEALLENLALVFSLP